MCKAQGVSEFPGPMLGSEGPLPGAEQVRAHPIYSCLGPVIRRRLQDSVRAVLGGKGLTGHFRWVRRAQEAGLHPSQFHTTLTSETARLC